jgi:hypothetical protein
VRANHRCTEVFKCGNEGCAFLTTSRSGLRDHHRTHHGGTDAPLKCALCPFTTPSQEALAQVLAGYYCFWSPVLWNRNRNRRNRNFLTSGTGTVTWYKTAKKEKDSKISPKKFLQFPFYGLDMELEPEPEP